MTDLVYVIKFNLCFSVLVGFYFLVLRNSNHFTANRLFLLFSLPLSALIPPAEQFLAYSHIGNTAMILLPDVSVSQYFKNPLSAFSHFSLLEVSLIVSILLTVPKLNALIGIIRLKTGSEKKLFRGIRYYLSSDTNTAFSFFRIIVVPDKDYEPQELHTILLHEKHHADNWHSIDVLIAQTTAVLFWFNPFVYLYRKLLVSNHEYTADKIFAQNSDQLKRYVEFLLRQTTNARACIANQFTNSLILKRLEMMKKTKTQSNLRMLWALPAAAALLFAFAFTNTSSYVSEKQELNSSTGIEQDLPDEMPEFPGGDNALRKFIAENTNYPEEAVKQKLEDKVFVEFTVEKTGQVSNAKVLKGDYEILNTEALRVVNLLPDYKPAKKNGTPVSVQMTLPFTFKL